MADPIVLRWVGAAGVGSALIEWFSHAQYSHVGALLPDGSELGARANRIGRIPPGVRVRPPNYEPFTRTLVVTLPSTDDQREAFWRFLNSQGGKPYDYGAILGFASDRNWRNPDSWFCSELQTRALEVCGWFTYDLALTDYKITPGDLLLAVSAKMQVSLAEDAA